MKTDKGDETPTKSKKSKKSPKKDESKKEEKKGAKTPPKAKKGPVTMASSKKKTSMPKKIEKIEHFSNTPGLTDQQRDYESKLWPRHYKENVINARMRKFDEIESIMTKSMQRPGGRAEPVMEYAQYNKGGSMIGRDDRTTETCGLKP